MSESAAAVVVAICVAVTIAAGIFVILLVAYIFSHGDEP